MGRKSLYSKTKIIFKCDRAECDTVKTVYSSTYFSSKTHYCCKECRIIDLDIGYITYVCNAKGCTNTKRQLKSKYKRSVKHFCSNECRSLTYRIDRTGKPKDKGISRKERRENFLKRWQRMKWLDVNWRNNKQ